MRLFAAIVPPRPVLDEICGAVESVRAPVLVPAPRRGLFGRLRGGTSVRDPQGPPVSGGPEPEFAISPSDRMHLPITHFGNVTRGDSVKLAEALRAEAARWRRPQVHFAGAAALEWPGDQSVWAKLEGDLDDLSVIGRGVPRLVQRLGFFVDRRQFRPWLSVGTITESTTAPYLERLVEVLESFRGQDWTVESVSLMERIPTSTGPMDFEEIERMPLGTR
jgi:RNA 2',3'-cyclic 3'-phosphodiesterase